MKVLLAIVILISIGILVKTWKALKTVNVSTPKKLPELAPVVEVESVTETVSTKKPRKPRTKTPKDAGNK